MPARNGTAHVVTTTRKYKNQVYRTHLLRRSYREGGSVKNETLGNLSHLPEGLIDIIRRSLQGERFVPLAQPATLGVGLLAWSDAAGGPVLEAFVQTARELLGAGAAAAAGRAAGGGPG